MNQVSVPAIYDGENIHLLEDAPVQGRYRVVVTFVEPESEGTDKDDGLFWSSFNAWQDDRPIEATLEDIYAARRTKHNPPTL